MKFLLKKLFYRNLSIFHSYTNSLFYILRARNLAEIFRSFISRIEGIKIFFSDSYHFLALNQETDYPCRNSLISRLVRVTSRIKGIEFVSLSRLNVFVARFYYSLELVC